MKPLRVCFYGNQGSGSWKIRGRQIASTHLSWSCPSRLTPAHIMQHDVFCFVKRAERGKMEMLQRLGKIVIYDILDCWKQPEDGERCDDMDKVHKYFRQYLLDLPADGVIFPNRTMYEDLGHLVKNPICLYHHFRPTLSPITVKRQPFVVGYEGEEAYLGPWKTAMEEACGLYNLTFVVNPTRYLDLDIGFTARGGPHASLLACRYKSNVKMANFYGAALPCIAHEQERACVETNNGQVRFFRNQEELPAVLAELLPYETRLHIHRTFLETRKQFTLEHVAGLYEAFFREVVAQVCDGISSALAG